MTKGLNPQGGLASKSERKGSVFNLMDKKLMEGIPSGRQSLDTGIKVGMYL